MKKFLVMCSCLAMITLVKAQRKEPFTLFAGSNDGLRWKFFWSVNSVPADLNAFVLKRKKTGEKRWSVVNSSRIDFLLAAEKDYSNLNLSTGELEIFTQKISQLLSSGNLKATDNPTLLSQLADSNKLQQFQLVTALDYDIARAAGLGCDDSGLEPGVVYEYGLFLIINEREQQKPVTTLRVTGGEKFSFRDIYDFQVVPYTAKTSVQLQWKANSEKLNQLAHRGFNVYRKAGNEWIQLNRAPVISTNSKGYFSIIDSNASLNSVNEYSIRLISFFNFESEDNIYSFDPEEMLDNYSVPEIKNIDGSRPYSDGIIIVFGIDDKIKRHIAQFEIQRAYGSEYITVGTAQPSDTSFVDRQRLAPKEYYAYRIKANYKDGTVLYSDAVLLYYLPKILPPAPKNLRATVRNQNKRTFITLEWEKGSPDDTITMEFYVYASHPLTNKIKWVNFEEAITQPRFVYEVQTDFSAIYRFCVSALGKYMYESETSDTIEVKVTSKYLPVPVVTGWEVDSSSASFRWDYPAIEDLKGFRIYRDGMLIISENDLPADVRFFSTGPMRYFSRYVFEIEAVSVDGLASMRSIPIEIITEKQKKQLNNK